MQICGRDHHRNGTNEIYQILNMDKPLKQRLKGKESVNLGKYQNLCRGPGMRKVVISSAP